MTGFTLGNYTTLPPLTNTVTVSNTAIWQNWLPTTTVYSPVRIQLDAWNQWVTELTPPVVERALDRVADINLGGRRGEPTDEGYRARRAEAHSRAEDLLRLLLTPAQWRAYQEHEAFEVVGSLGRTYRIRHGVAGNIAIIEDGQEVARICAHPEVYDAGTRGYLPTEDVLIGQVLHLTSDEASFLRVANLHAGRIPELRVA